MFLTLTDQVRLCSGVGLMCFCGLYKGILFFFSCEEAEMILKSSPQGGGFV